MRVNPPGSPRSGARRVLLAVVPLVLALAGLLGWRLLVHANRTPEPPAPERDAERPRPEAARAATLEAAGADVAREPRTERSSAAATHAPASAPVAKPAAGLAARANGPWSYRGYVLDIDLDQPLPGATLVFESDAALGPVRELFRAESDAQGRFRTQVLDHEPRWMRVEPPEGFLADEARVDLAERRGEILVPLHRDPRTLAGAIRGELLREGGAWTEETLPRPGTVMIDLVPVGGAKWSRRAELVSEADDQGRTRLRFEFGSLPHGEYELTLSSLGAFRWSPVAQRVTPPAEGITFLRYDLDRSTSIAFHVVDRESGAEIEHFEVRQLQLTPSQDNGVFLQTGPLERSAVPLDARFKWSLWAEGYRPAFGDESAFLRRGDERVAEVALERGWATQVLVLARDPAPKPAVRAEVLVDGRSCGFTAEDGTLAVRAAKEPQRIEVRYAGWTMQNDPLQAYNGKSAAQRGQVTIVMLEKPK